MELGSSRQWLRVVQSKIVHLNLEVAVRVFESLQESSADTSNFCSSETFKSFLNISARVSYLTVNITGNRLCKSTDFGSFFHIIWK